MLTSFFCYIFSADTHSFVTLGDIREELQTKFEDILTQCRVKVSELCALEKKTWQTVDSLSEKCADMVTQIEDTAEDQVSVSATKSIMYTNHVHMKQIP